MSRLKILPITSLFCLLLGQYAKAQPSPAGFSVEAIPSVTIPLTTNKMTNIVFPTAIKPGVKVNRDILTERPTGTTNVLVLRAAYPAFAPTNLSVYGLDGRLYSFDLRFEADPPSLNFKVLGEGVVDKMPLEKDAESVALERPFLHRVAGASKMKLILRGIYLKNGIMWFSLQLENHSEIAYSPENIRWLIREGRNLKRTAAQEIELNPAFVSPLQSLGGNSSSVLTVGFRPFTLARNKKLAIRLTDQGGSQNLILTLTPNCLFKAKLL